jgi:peptidylprolyl isomerase
MKMKTVTPPTATLALAVLLLGLSAPALAETPARKPATPPQVAPAQTVPPAPPSAETTPTIKASEVIARVGTSDITADEVRAVVAALDDRQKAALVRDPALLTQAVRAVLANRLVLKEARAKKWDEQPAVAAQLERARENTIVETYLHTVAAPPDGFPSEAEIKAVYDSNATAFLVPRQFQLAQIVVVVAKNADKAAEDKARKKVDDVQKKLAQPGADFAALAKSESGEGETAEKGGEIGWLTEAQLRPEIRSQIVGLAKGASTDPVRLDDGWHILKLLDTKASQTRPLAEVRDALVERMRAERIEANRRAYVAELFKQSPPVINELALSKLFEAAAPSASAH